MIQILINTILFFFQFESLGNGCFTVGRAILIPLLIIYFFCTKKVRIPSNLPIWIFFLFFIVEFFSGLVNLEYSFSVTSFMHAITLIVFIDYFRKNDGLSSTNWLMLGSYDLVTIFLFITSYGGFSLDNRFMSIYWDPNVMAIYILISFVAKINLLSNEKRMKWKFFYYMFILLDVLIILSSLSRAALITLIVICLLLIYRYSAKLAIVLVLSFLGLVNYMYIISSDLVWSVDLSIIEILSFRFFTMSEVDSVDMDGSRSARLQMFFNSLKQGEISMIGNGTSYLPDGSFIHNGIAEFLLAVGPIMGILFLCVFLYLLYRNLLLPIVIGKINLALLLPISFFITTVFYSYLSFKSFWIFIAYLIYCNYRQRKFQDLSK